MTTVELLGPSEAGVGSRGTEGRDMDTDEIRSMYDETSTIAVVGASRYEEKAAHRIPRYLSQQGYEIIPVNPNADEVLGERAADSLEEVAADVDVVNVFRPAEEAPGIARQAAQIGAEVLWLQQGIVSEEAASIARDAGLTVVMDRCMGTTHQQLDLDS